MVIVNGAGWWMMLAAGAWLVKGVGMLMLIMLLLLKKLACEGDAKRMLMMLAVGS